MRKILLSLICVFSANALAADSKCPEHYAKGIRPDVSHRALNQNTYEICMSGFAVYYSGVTKTPLWSAYYLTPQRIKKASQVKRDDRFAPYAKLPKPWRAELEDYRSTGLDRGHLAPFAVMSTAKEGYESFYLINIVPQHAAFNRGEWSSIESRVRQHARTEAVYVITGALFLDRKLERLNQRVLSPSHLYKLVYSPAKKQAMAFVATNKPKTQVRLLSASELERFSRGSIVLPREIGAATTLRIR